MVLPPLRLTRDELPVSVPSIPMQPPVLPAHPPPQLVVESVAAIITSICTAADVAALLDAVVTALLAADVTALLAAVVAALLAADVTTLLAADVTTLLAAVVAALMAAVVAALLAAVVYALLSLAAISPPVATTASNILSLLLAYFLHPIGAGTAERRGRRGEVVTITKETASVAYDGVMGALHDLALTRPTVGRAMAAWHG